MKKGQKGKKNKFCKHGHEISKVKRDKWGRCLGCYEDRKAGPRPPKQFCLRGHDTFICGRSARRRCNDCTAEDQKKNHPLKCGGQLKRICRRGHDTKNEGRIGGKCRDCGRDDVRKRRKKIKIIKIKKGIYKLPRYQNLVGKRFGRLLIAKFDHKRPYPNGRMGIFWFANCDCGNFTVISSKSLQCGTESCGCLIKESASKLAKKLFKTYGNAAYKIRKYPLWCSQFLSQLKVLYGLTPKDWTKLVLESNGQCNLCNEQFKNPRDCAVDHNHATGKIRGLLCRDCNLLLGFAKDSIKILEKAGKYLLEN